MRLSSRPLVACLWNDAHAAPIGELTQDDINLGAPYQFMTYGLLVRDDAHIVAIAMEEAEDGRFRGVTYIPRGMVEKLTVLGAPKAKRARKSKDGNGTTRRSALLRAVRGDSRSPLAEKSRLQQE